MGLDGRITPDELAALVKRAHDQDAQLVAELLDVARWLLDPESVTATRYEIAERIRLVVDRLDRHDDETPLSAGATVPDAAP